MAHRLGWRTNGRSIVLVAGAALPWAGRRTKEALKVVPTRAVTIPLVARSNDAGTAVTVVRTLGPRTEQISRRPMASKQPT